MAAFFDAALVAASAWLAMRGQKGAGQWRHKAGK